MDKILLNSYILHNGDIIERKENTFYYRSTEYTKLMDIRPSKENASINVDYVVYNTLHDGNVLIRGWNNDNYLVIPGIPRVIPLNIMYITIRQSSGISILVENKRKFKLDIVNKKALVREFEISDIFDTEHVIQTNKSTGWKKFAEESLNFLPVSRDLLNIIIKYI